MKFDFDIPKELAHLKIDEKGYPIPFFAPIIDGKPNFKFQDEKKRDLCLLRKLCPICGKKLPKDYSYIITGPLGLQNRISSDAMMHRVCAEFSLSVCPHLYFYKSERKIETSKNPYIVKDKPSELFLVKVSKFKGEFDKIAQTMLIRFTPVSSEKYIYQDNVLIKAE